MTSSTPPLTHRSHLAQLVPPGGTVIELGVAAGAFARQMLWVNPLIHYIGIDRWSDHHDMAEKRLAMETIQALTSSAEIVQSTFENALPLFGKTGTADLIYIDGYAHTGQEGGKTLADWWPAVKRGGIFAGHDYAENYPQTIVAVDCFVRTHGLELRIIDDGALPSWWVVKP